MSATATNASIFDKSSENNTILIELREKFAGTSADVKGLAQNVSNFVEAQQLENSKLHRRIDDAIDLQRKAEDRQQAGIDAIKDLVSTKGRIGLAHIAIIVSFLTTAGLITHAYVGMRVEPLENNQLDVKEQVIKQWEHILELRINDAVLNEKLTNKKKKK